MARLEPQFLDSPRRRAAMYLSTVAVDPSLQGKGLGVALMEDGLARCEAMAGVSGGEGQGESDGKGCGEGGNGRSCWLVARLGTEKFYQRFGFQKIGDSAVDEVSHWNGGAIMFRE